MLFWIVVGRIFFRITAVVIDWLVTDNVPDLLILLSGLPAVQLKSAEVPEEKRQEEEAEEMFPICFRKKKNNVFFVTSFYNFPFYCCLC